MVSGLPWAAAQETSGYFDQGVENRQLLDQGPAHSAGKRWAARPF